MVSSKNHKVGRGTEMMRWGQGWGAESGRKDLTEKATLTRACVRETGREEPCEDLGGAFQAADMARAKALR